MTTTNSKRNLEERIAAARKKFKPIVKDGWNPHYKKPYATLDNVINCIGEALLEEGVVIRNIPDVLPNGMLVLRTRLIDIASGDYIEGMLPLINSDKPQEQGSAITYARRYSISALLNLCTETDDDGNQGSGLKPVADSKNKKVDW